ncbi:MAG: substrate-binding domain-containing protein [Treponema sp.]|nr:substrate-binding domain-containing protein [Treponema sp.]
MKRKTLSFFLLVGVAGVLSFLMVVNINKIISENTKPLNITFIRMKEGGQFWSTMRNGAREARTDTHNTVDFYSTVKTSDVSMQISYIRKAVEQGTDCIVITPCSYYLLKKPLEEAEKAGVKIISLYNEYDRQEDSSAIFYMTDLHPAGRALARKLLDNRKSSSINAVIVGSFDTVSSEKYLAEGILDVFKTDPNIKCSTLYAGRDVDSISNQIADSLIRDKSINLIIALNDETSEGIRKALKTVKKNPALTVVVSSNSLANIESLETGSTDYILVINSFAMGYQSIYAAVDLIKGKEVKNASVDFTIVNKRNMFDPDIQKKLFPLM